MTTSISVKTLVPGDVLLYRSNTVISWLIRQLDKAPVSHAGLYVGDGKVAEALMKPGLIKQPISRSVTGCERVEVFRLRGEDVPMEPVLSVANYYLGQGNRYAYEQIVLLAGICLTRKIDLESPVLRAVVRRAMRHASDVIDYLHADDKEPMICSEFVFLCYDRAEPGIEDPYSLEVSSQSEAEPRRRFSTFRRQWAGRKGENAPRTAAPHPASLLGMLEDRPEHALSMEQAELPASATRASIDADIEGLAELIEEYRREADVDRRVCYTSRQDLPDISIEELLGEAARLARGLGRTIVRRADVDSKRLGYACDSAIEKESPGLVLADFVTPGDLYASRSLVCKGRLEPL